MSDRPQACNAGWDGELDGVFDTEAFRYGLDLFGAGYYWEAHEWWEALWMVCPKESAQRCVLQGHIQTAAAMLKVGRGQWSAFASLRKRASKKFTKARARGYQGTLDVAMETALSCAAKASD